MATTVWLWRSMMLFYYGVYGAEKWHRIPSSAQYAVNSDAMNLPPLSVRSTQSLQPHSFSSAAWWCLWRP